MAAPVECPRCQVRVVPSPDGMCPSCHVSLNASPQAAFSRSTEFGLPGTESVLPETLQGAEEAEDRFQAVSNQPARIPTWAGPVVGPVVGGILGLVAALRSQEMAEQGLAIVTGVGVAIGLVAGLVIMFLDLLKRN